MKKIERRNRLTALAAVALILLAAVIRNSSLFSEFYLNQVAYILVYLIYIGLITAWTVSLKQRIMQKNILRYLLLIAGLMMFWIVVRTVKFKFTPDDSIYERIFWYAYYIPLIFIPLLGFYISLCLGNDEKNRPEKRYLFLLIPAVSLAFIFLSNDWHQRVFVFRPDMDNCTVDYRYGLFYYVAMTWFFFFSFLALHITTKKSRSQLPSRRAFVPLLIIFSGIFYVFAYIFFDFRFIEMTAMSCFLIAAVLESHIRSGLIPSNARYDVLLDYSLLDIQLRDLAGQVRFGTDKNFSPDKDDFFQGLQTGQLEGDETWEYHSAPIQGGYVLWRENIAKITRTNKRLKEYRDFLAENNLIIRKELDSTSESLRIKEKTRLFTLIREKTKRQLREIEWRLAMMPEDNPEVCKKMLTEICFFASFIKRRGHLLLLKEESLFAGSYELYHSLGESCRMLEALGISGELAFPDEFFLPVDIIEVCYVFFEQAVKDNLESLERISISLENGRKTYSYIIEMTFKEGCSFTWEKRGKEELALLGGELTFTSKEEGLSSLILSFAKGGDSQ